MREFVGNPKIKSDLEQFEKIRNCAIAFCEYVNSGGNVCDFTDKMIDKVIDCAMLLKADRDEMYSRIGIDVPIYNPDGTKAELIMN